MATKKTTKKTTTKKTASKKALPKKATTKASGAKPAAAKATEAPKAKVEPKPEAPSTARVKEEKEPKQAKQPKPPREQVRDPRLPEPGTVIQKRDRQGNVRCECTVEADGVRYNGTLYRSLSAAAMAAAKDMSLGGKTQNGFTFWGLSKPPRKGVDPIAAIEKAWQRYRDRLHATISNGLSDENRERVHALVQQHGEVLVELREGAR